MTKVMWTVVQAAKVLGIQGKQVRALLVRGELKGERTPRPGAVYGKRQANWQVDPVSVKAYLAQEAERRAARMVEEEARVLKLAERTEQKRGAGTQRTLPLLGVSEPIDLRPVLGEIRDALVGIGAGLEAVRVELSGLREAAAATAGVESFT